MIINDSFLHIRIPGKLKRRLERDAKKKKRHAADHIRRILSDYLEHR